MIWKKYRISVTLFVVVLGIGIFLGWASPQTESGIAGLLSPSAERGSNWLRSVVDEGNARTFIIQDRDATSAGLTVAENEQILVNSIRITGLNANETPTVLILTESSGAQFAARANDHETQEFHLDPPLKLTTGKQIGIMRTSSNSMLIEFRGTPIASSTNRSETMTVR